ncbi:aldo/keto reductase [Oceanobacillus alkalisoli]|uniref:aldo/keto reductase n=1 Tax=Oceanobacillus alkalisoli TaxID=2925113 RepID=UPI003F6EAEDF
MSEPKVTVNAVLEALRAGYRAIDTASYYKNEKEVGEAIRLSEVPREELFITTKVWNDEQGYDETLRAFEKSLRTLGLDYIDLYLIHWPLPDIFVDTYRAIERLYEEKLIRVPGVSNHHEKHLLQLENKVNTHPMINQVECHPYLQQRDLKEFCEERQIAVTAWSPLVKGNILQDELVKSLAQKHAKTPAQIILRWHLERNTIVIPKSVTASRIKENFDLFNFRLEEKDMEKMSKLDCNGRLGIDPETEDFRFL